MSGGAQGRCFFPYCDWLPADGGGVGNGSMTRVPGWRGRTAAIHVLSSGIHSLPKKPVLNCLGSIENFKQNYIL
jgi:hypothetical protein